MTELQTTDILFEHDDFEFDTIDEELLVDQRCQQLLNRFYLYLQQRGVAVELASDMAYSADLYLRDYLIDFARQNVVRPQPGIIRKFAGSWFITHTLDPEMEMLDRHLSAIVSFYSYLHSQHMISADELAFLVQEADQNDYYKNRIDTFLGITGDGFVLWDQECPARF
ncbi:MAG: hypothetical protein Q7V04_08665 [Deltaproteobacteria bacterium]|nr:hypothetical protein [Deltaproteobacteria bacterium]